MSGLPTAKEAAADIWRSLSLPDSDLDHLMFTGEPDSAVNSSFRLGVAAQFVFIGCQRGLTFHVNLLDSEAWYTLNGGLPKGEVWDPIAGLYETKNGGFVRIHTNFAHHRSGILKALGIPEIPTPTKEDVQSALQQWEAVAFETAAAAMGMCAAALRSFDGWGEHLQAKSLIGTMPVSLIKIGEAPKRQVVKDAKYALEGIRVLDLSRVLAGPVAGRTLAAHGAEVLLVTSPNLPSLPLLDIETSIGKRTTQLDLTTEDDHCRLVDLARGADVFLQAYRPRGLEKLGFGTEELASLRPGIISANLCAWGWDGPWKDRRGVSSELALIFIGKLKTS
ncbi:hypothetical protein H0H87_009706 [Tephrocybe sp. NHM501043]|nr:hypothetical protein H0H87_009706 [Tephrocybe sp. NHM501043]